MRYLLVRLLFAVSRERRARRRDATAVVVLLALCVALGVLAVVAGR